MKSQHPHTGMISVKKVRQAKTYVTCLLIVAFAFSSISGLVVEVSQNSGNDTAGCLVSSSSPPCKTLIYALKAANNLSPDDKILQIQILDDVYPLKRQVDIVQSREDRTFTIIADPNKSRVVFTCASSSARINVTAHNVRFVNLLFQECGPRFAAVVTAWNSRNIVFRNCTFQHNLMAGINAFESSVTVEDCTFLNNTSNFYKNGSNAPYVRGKVSAGGGAAFIFRDANRLSIFISRTVFSQNSAIVNETEHFIAPSSNVSHFSTGGGGLLVAFLGTTENCEVTLDHTRFNKNRATYGGGIYVAAGNRAQKNRFVLSNSEIWDNFAGQAGGGAVVSQWDKSTKISMYIRKSTIANNWSRRGAGINVFYMNFVERAHDSVFVLDTVTFQGNRGNSSTAIRFASALPFGYPIAAMPEIINCTFIDHVTENLSFTAPLTSQRVSLVFKGLNVFKNNFGSGAVELENSNIHVNGTLRFINNTGHRGGALSLRASQLKIYANSEILFLRNHAETVGGAIAVATHMMYEVIHVYNPDCFLTYHSPETCPSAWQTNISFIENSAGLKGAAIYIASLGACLWDEHYPYYNLQKSLRWDDAKFVYRGNYLQSTSGERSRSGHEFDIATDTAHFHAPQGEESLVKLAPGESITLHIQGVDQLGNTVYTVASVSQVNRSSPLQLRDNMRVLSPVTNSTLPFVYDVSKSDYQKLNHSFLYKIHVTDVYSTLANKFTFAIRPRVCPAGFSFKDTKCACDSTIAGVLRCGEGRIVYLKEGYWGGVQDNKLITHYCPYKYCKCTKQGELPGCRFDPSHPNEQCAPRRHGMLCGSCEGNSSVGLRWEQCLDCTDSSGWILAVVVIVVTLLSVLVIWLNPSLSSDLRGPLFFFQVLPFIFPPSNEVSEVVTFFANMFNFGGPFVYLFKTCIVDGMNNVYAVAIGYLMPLVTLLIFLVSYILSANYFIRFKFRTHSSLHSFWLIILFMYNYLVETTFLLLFCTKVGKEHVFFYDGTVTCFQGDHRGMAVLALLVLLVLIIPPPIIIVLLTKGIWKVDPQYVSTLTNGLRPRCQWWWAFDLGRRVLLVGIEVFIPNQQIKQVVISLMCVLIFAVHSNMHPYKKALVNYVESFYLLALCTLAIVLVLDDPPDLYCGLLLTLLSLHTFVILAFKAYRFFKKRFGSASTSSDGPRPNRYGSLENDQFERNLDPETKTRRAILETIFSNSSESGPKENRSSEHGQ